jgi:hypothetical protein
MGIIEAIESIGTAISKIPDVLGQFFLVGRDIIWGAQIFFLNIYVLLVVLTFFGIIVLIVWLPVKYYPVIVKNKKILKKLLFF